MAMTMLSPSRQADPARVFEDSVRSVLEEVRASLATIVERITPLPRRAAEMQRTLALDSHLSWSIFSAANTPDALAIASLLPGERAVAKFLDRAKANGVPPSDIERAELALVEFDRAVQTHAGGREMFESMVASLTVHRANADSETDLRNKRAAFRALSMLWGRQANQLLESIILHPSRTPGLIDRAYIGGLIGLRQTRPDSSFKIRRMYSRLPLPGDPVPPPLEPLSDEPVSDEYPWGVVLKLCSESLPKFRVFTDEDGVIYHELAHRIIGATDEMTCIWGHVARDNEASPASTPGTEVSHIRCFTTPLSLSVTDMVVHESIWDERLPEVRVYQVELNGRTTDIREDSRMALREEVRLLGRGLEAARSPEIPTQASMLAYAFDRLGWNPKEFRVFRCRVEYPLLYTRLHMMLHS